MMLKACSGDNPVGGWMRDMGRTVQRESMGDSLFERGGSFFAIPFTVFVHVYAFR